MEENNTKTKVIKSLEEHTLNNGYIDINKLIYEMHGVLSEKPSENLHKLSNEQ